MEAGKTNKKHLNFILLNFLLIFWTLSRPWDELILSVSGNNTDVTVVPPLVWSPDNSYRKKKKTRADTALTHGPPSPKYWLLLKQTVLATCLFLSTVTTFISVTVADPCRHACSCMFIRWSPSNRVAPRPWPSAYGEGHGKNITTQIILVILP